MLLSVTGRPPPCCPQACPIVPKPAPLSPSLPHTPWAQRRGCRGGGLGTEQTQKSSWRGLWGRDYRVGRLFGMTYGVSGGDTSSVRHPPACRPPFAFQSPKRSSASGSAPRDSTRRVRRSVGSPPHNAGLDFGRGRHSPPSRQRCERAGPQPRFSLPAAVLTHRRDINSPRSAEPRLGVREQLLLLLSAPRSSVGGTSPQTSRCSPKILIFLYLFQFPSTATARSPRGRRGSGRRGGTTTTRSPPRRAPSSRRTRVRRKIPGMAPLSPKPGGGQTALAGASQ